MTKTPELIEDGECYDVHFILTAEYALAKYASYQPIAAPFNLKSKTRLRFADERKDNPAGNTDLEMMENAIWNLERAGTPYILAGTPEHVAIWRAPRGWKSSSSTERDSAASRESRQKAQLSSLTPNRNSRLTI